VLEQWRVSGMSRAAFCRLRGISYHTLNQWKSRIEADADHQAAPGRARFIEFALPTAPAAPTESSAPSAAASYEIGLSGGRWLRVSPGFDESDVARLIAVVESC